MSLKPNETIHKYLISSPCRFIGQYETNDLLIAHSWISFSNSSDYIREEASPISRHGFVITFSTEPIEKKPGIVIPNYSPTGIILCSYLSVFYGKRFDAHGLLESCGMFNMPDLREYYNITNHKMPYNSHIPRKNYPVPLNICFFLSLDEFFNKNRDNGKLINIIRASSRFYLLAIQNIEFDPELAYINLITAGEILSSFFKYTDSELIDEKTLHILSIITSTVEDGLAFSNSILHSLKSIKKRFVKTITSLCDDTFFEQHEGQNGFAYFSKTNFENNIKAAYDLRSKYIHTGINFGNWIKPDSRMEDLQIGEPVTGNHEFDKILSLAPKFIGLERVIRYSIIRLMLDNGLALLEQS